MKTFTKEKKDALLAEIIRHQEADQIIQGTYSNDKNEKAWKGCAVGCSIHSLNILEGKNIKTNDHKAYETELGIPEKLAQLEDRLFEGMNAESAKLWPGRFIAAVPSEADLSLVLPKFFIRILTDPKKGTRRLCKPKGVIATDMVAGLYKDVVDGKKVTKDQWKLAVSAASAYAYAYAAAYVAAAYAAAAYAASANAADYAATYASAAYAYAYASDSDYASASEKHFSWMADVLIEILEDTNLTTKV